MKKRGFTLVELVIVVVIVGILVCMGGCFKSCVRTGAFGPKNTFEAVCTRTYVDAAGDNGSHYMVATDAGVFECDNSFLLGIWNCDEIYARFQPGRRYRITTKGEKVVNLFFQEYPYITRAEEIPAPVGQALPGTPPVGWTVQVVTNYVMVTNVEQGVRR